MIRYIVGSRSCLTLILTVGIGTLLSQRFPFPEDNAVLQLVAAEKPVIFIAIKYAYQMMLFSTPFIGCSLLFSIFYIFFVRPRESVMLNPLLPNPMSMPDEGTVRKHWTVISSEPILVSGPTLGAGIHHAHGIQEADHHRRDRRSP